MLKRTMCGAGIIVLMSTVPALANVSPCGSALGAQQCCKTGCACGNACISCSKTCRVSSAAAGPRTVSTPVTPSQPPQPRAQLRRVGSPSEIDSLGKVATRVLRTVWAGGSQFVRSTAGCTMVLVSGKTAGDVVTEDMQTVDVGDLASTWDDRADVLAGTVDARIRSSKGGTFVQRRRAVTLDGAPQTPRTERTVFLSISAPEGDPRGEMLNMKEALLRYSIACEKR